MCHTVLVTCLITVTKCQREALKGGRTWFWLLVVDPFITAGKAWWSPQQRDVELGHVVSRELEPEAGQATIL